MQAHGRDTLAIKLQSVHGSAAKFPQYQRIATRNMYTRTRSWSAACSSFFDQRTCSSRSLWPGYACKRYPAASLRLSVHVSLFSLRSLLSVSLCPSTLSPVFCPSASGARSLAKNWKTVRAWRRNTTEMMHLCFLRTTSHSASITRLKPFELAIWPVRNLFLPKERGN